MNWLEEQAPSKNGPSGIGRDNYTWYQQNVHLVPLSWEDEVRLLKRELDRAWSSLKLEEHRNRHLPPLVPASSPAEYDALADRSASRFIEFLRDKEIVMGQLIFIEPENLFQRLFNVLRRHTQSIPCRHVEWSDVDDQTRSAECAVLCVLGC